MTKSIIKFIFVTFISVGVVSAVNAASISLNPLSSSVQVGSDFSVELNMDFSDEATLGGGVDVIYDGLLADFVGFTFDSNFLSVTDPSFTCPRAPACSPIDQVNSVSNIAFGNFLGLSGPYTVGTLVFTAVNAGNISLLIAETIGSSGPFVSAVTFSPMRVNYTGTTVVSAVPLPASIWLFFSGLALLGYNRKRRKNI